MYNVDWRSWQFYKYSLKDIFIIIIIIPSYSHFINLSIN